MAKDVQDSIEFLLEAKQALAVIDNEKNQQSRLQQEEKKLQRTLSTEKKNLEDLVSTTIAKRKEEITGSYDKEITKTQDKLKKARARRNRAKEKGVKARMQKETAELREEIRRLKEANSTTLHKNGIPSFCNTKLYFALYFTKNFSDFLLLLLSFAIGFVLIPCGIYFLIPERKLFMLIIIYVLDIIILLFLYILLNNRTKVNHLEPMREVRKNRDMIDANKRKIRVIKKAIEKDKNEALYNLGKYDEEIRAVEEELEDIAQRKQEALTIFEKETQHELETDIRDGRKEKIDGLSKKLREVSGSCQEVSDSIQQKSIAFTDAYGPYIGQEFMSTDSIGKMITMIEDGVASSVSEAQQLYKNVK